MASGKTGTMLFYSAKGPRPPFRRNNGRERQPWPPDEYDPVLGGDLAFCSECHYCHGQWKCGAGTEVRMRCHRSGCKAFLTVRMLN